MQGVSEGLASLHKGGIRPQTLIIDDGWQMTQVDEDYEGKIMLINMHSICDCIFMVTRFPVVALGESSLPNDFLCSVATMSHCAKVGQMVSVFGHTYVETCHCRGGLGSTPCGLVLHASVWLMFACALLGAQDLLLMQHLAWKTSRLTAVIM